MILNYLFIVPVCQVSAEPSSLSHSDSKHKKRRQEFDLGKSFDLDLTVKNNPVLSEKEKQTLSKILRLTESDIEEWKKHAQTKRRRTQ